jgi:hypothetical protein
LQFETPSNAEDDEEAIDDVNLMTEAGGRTVA